LTPAQDATATKPRRKKKLIQKQANMLRVLYALAPVAVLGVYFFGWRVLALLAITTATGFFTEFVTSRQRGASISTAVFVTCGIYTLSLPPGTPYWVSMIGIVVAVLFGKEVFGGFGRNFANPAIVGRAFVYVSFPQPLTAGFVPVFKDWPGGFAHWSMRGLLESGRLPQYLADAQVEAADAISAATPMWARRDFGYVTDWKDLLLGNIGGTFDSGAGIRVLEAGCIGEVSALLMIAAAAYLIITKTSNWRLTTACLAGAVLANVLFRHVLGYQAVPPLHFTLFSGALMFAAVFIVTDPVSATKKPLAMWVYGGFIGFMVVFLRWKGQFAGAVAFAILLGNILGPLLDLGATWWAGRAKAPVSPAPATLEKGKT
jgi:Na+-transporting NADH:ubiquinone oxidoreductase subunit B